VERLTGNKVVARHFLVDLVDRGLDVEQGVLGVRDGGKALRARPARCLVQYPSSAASAPRSAT